MNTHMPRHRRAAVLALAAAAATGLGGCVSRDMSDLEAYTQEVMSRKGGLIEPLPEIKPYERYLYQAKENGGRDPFTPFERAEMAGPEGPKPATDDPAQIALREEISNRNREELEQFELDSLRMVGTLEKESDLWAIVRDATGVVHKVKVGNYLGRNNGKIFAIFEDHIELREIVQGDNGVLEERQATLALAEE